MKERFLSTKPKQVLITLAMALNVKNANKLSRAKLISKLMKHSYKQLKDAYKGKV